MLPPDFDLNLSLSPKASQSAILSASLTATAMANVAIKLACRILAQTETTKSADELYNEAFDDVEKIFEESKADILAKRGE